MYVFLSVLAALLCARADLSVHMLLLGAKVAATQLLVASHRWPQAACEAAVALLMSLPL